MSLQLLHQFEAEQKLITQELLNRLPDGEAALVYGSVSRAFGPFGDVDLITFGDGYILNREPVGGVPIQEHPFSVADFEDYITRTPRGAHAAVDGFFVGDTSAEIVGLFAKQRIDLSYSKQADYVALMVAEQAGDPTRPDIRGNTTLYALKRSIGGKRPFTRSYLMSLMMQSEPVLDGSPSERIKRLVDEKIITEKIIEEAFCINSILLAINKGMSVSHREWQEASKNVADWNAQIISMGEEFCAQTLPQSFLAQLSAASSENEAEQLSAAETLSHLGTDPYKAKTILWRLVANTSICEEALQRVWEECDKSPRILRELGCCAVQLPQFDKIEVNPDSALLNQPDVQFSLNYRLRGNRSE